MKMKTDVLFLLCLVVIMVQMVGAKTASGVITQDTSWSGTITVTGDVMVSSGTLTIQPGTVVRFAELNDNIVFGNYKQIRLVAMLQGGIQAVGTAGQRITFTTASAAPEPGDWGKIQVIANENRSRFAYCDLLYARDGIDVSNPSGYTGTSSVSVSCCSFQHLGNLPLYCYQGSEMTVDHCLVEDCVYGVYANRASSITVSYSYFNNTANAVLVAGLESDTCHASIDHVTIYNVDLYKDPAPKWWTGYGIFFSGTIGYSEGKVTNTIFDECDIAGMDRNGWDIDYGHNCWDTGLTNCYENDPLAPTDISADPAFWSPGSDFSISPASPCYGTASDGLNRGAWQEGDTWPYQHTTGQLHSFPEYSEAGIQLEMAPNPFTSRIGIRVAASPGETVFRIFDMYGQPVYTAVVLSGNSGFTWEGKNDAGNRVQPGTYLCIVDTEAGRFSGKIVLTY